MESWYGAGIRVQCVLCLDGTCSGFLAREALSLCLGSSCQRISLVKRQAIFCVPASVSRQIKMQELAVCLARLWENLEH